MDETMINSTEKFQGTRSTGMDETFSTADTETMILGFQVCCKTVLDKIIATKKKPGKRSLNDYKRLIKELEEFCFTGLALYAKPNKQNESTNNSTKLMEEDHEL